MKMKCTATPPKSTDMLTEWCSSEFGTETLVRLPVRPHISAMPKHCALNVEIACNMFGGKLAEGWLLWDSYGVMITSEHHVAWEDPHGEIVDLTPQDGFSYVCFADTGRRFEIGTDDFDEFVGQWNDDHAHGIASCPYLLLRDHPRLQELAADLTATQVEQWRYKNQRHLAEVDLEHDVMAAFEDRLDALDRQLEDFANWKPKDSSKRRAAKKAERKRRKKQRQHCRR